MGFFYLYVLFIYDMTRLEYVGKIKDFVLTYKINSPIEIDGKTRIYIDFGKSNYIQVEGFDSKNVYLYKYLKDRNIGKSYILIYENAPYKILKKIYNFFDENQKVLNQSYKR